jgi:hypothetical protein
MKDDGPVPLKDPASAAIGRLLTPGIADAEIAAQMKRAQSFASDVQKAYLAAFNRHVEAVNTVNQKCARMLQGLMQARQPQETMVDTVELVAALIEATSDQNRTWADFAQALQGSCTAIAKETAADLRQRVIAGS